MGRYDVWWATGAAFSAWGHGPADEDASNVDLTNVADAMPSMLVCVTRTNDGIGGAWRSSSPGGSGDTN